MECSLNKSQLCWIIVRVIGLLCLFWGINMVVSIGSPWLLYGSGVILPVRITAAVVLQCAVWLLLAFYFLRRGAWVHRFLMYDYVVPEAMLVVERAPLDLETGMTDEDLVAFHEWQEDNPELTYLVLEKQVGHYRASTSSSRLI